MDTTELINKYQTFFEDEYKAKILSNLGKGELYIDIDFRKLARFDVEFADNLLEEPGDSIHAAELTIKGIIDDKNIKSFQILFSNLPKTQNMPLNDITNQLGKFLTFEGYVMKPSDKFLKVRSARFECPSCGHLINVLMPGDEFREPSRCGCGRKGKFIELSKELFKFQRFELVEAMDKIPDKPRKPVKKKVFIAENLLRKDINEALQAGQKVKITGFLELEEMRSKGMKKRSNEFRTNIVANNIIPIEHSWEAIKLNKQQKNKTVEMAARKKLLAEFAQSLAPSFEGYNMVRKSLILQHVGGKRIFDENGNLEERGIICILLSSKPGEGKSYLGKRSIEISPLKTWTTGKGLSAAGLVACVVRDEYGSFTLEVGPLVMADKGIILIDEMEKMNKHDFGMLNNAMAEEKTKITKANIDQELRTRTAILATSNPLHKTFTEYDSIISQLAPIPKDILDRFDVIWAMREQINQDKLENKYMSRHITGSNVTKQIWTNDEMQMYIAYTKRLNPTLSVSMAKYFNTKFSKLTGKTVKETGEESSTSHRLRGNIMRWVYAHGKFIGPGKEYDKNCVEITKQSIDFAFSLMRHSFTLLNLIDDKGFAKYEDMEDIPKKTEINKYYAVRNTIKELAKVYKNQVPEQRILEAMKKNITNFEMDDLDKELEKLRRASDVFEPRSGFWGMI